MHRLGGELLDRLRGHLQELLPVRPLTCALDQPASRYGDYLRLKPRLALP